MSDEKTTGLFSDYILDINVNCSVSVWTSSLLEALLS